MKKVPKKISKVKKVKKVKRVTGMNMNCWTIKRLRRITNDLGKIVPSNYFRWMRLFVSLFLFSVLGLFATFLHFYVPSVPRVPNCSWLKESRPQILAHRGTRYLAPEETLLAFEIAKEYGADVLELDVRLTLDGHLVVFHDSTVNRTTEGTGRVAEKTLQEMKSLDPAYRYVILHKNGTEEYPERGKGHLVQTLEEILAYFPNEKINIEVKDDKAEAAEALVAIANANPGLEDRVVVSSRYQQVIDIIRAKSKLCTGGCEHEAVMFTVLSLLRGYVFWYSFIDSPPAEVFQIPMESIGVRLDNEEQIEAAHIMNQKLHYWVVNDPESMERLLSHGADGIITDRVDIAVEVWDRMGIKKKALTSPPDRAYFPPIEIPDELHICERWWCQMFYVLLTLERYHLGAFLIALTTLLLWRRSTKQKRE